MSCSKQDEYDLPKMELPGSQAYAMGLEYLKRGAYPDALPYLQQAAEQHNPEAAYQLGLMYGAGEGVVADKQKSREWLLQAAMGGHPKAHYNLGHIYGTGDGVETNYEESLVWFWLASSYDDKAAKRYMRIVVQKVSAEQYNRAEQRVKEIWRQIPHETFKAEEGMAMH
ncbi:MAG: hypothetical protein A2V90_05105 [Gammaproteobacteria bacterium RBG_16_57_12]|nr:MAG: hypothetical protein A2V90_05105 [Gammaproteobacteria bacterium RBG_16_57_12]